MAPLIFSYFQHTFFKLLIKNPQPTNVLTFLTHGISYTGGVKRKAIELLTICFQKSKFFEFEFLVFKFNFKRLVFMICSHIKNQVTMQYQSQNQNIMCDVFQNFFNISSNSSKINFKSWSSEYASSSLIPLAITSFFKLMTPTLFED